MRYANINPVHIRIYRSNAGIPLSLLAKEAGLSNSHLSHLERGIYPLKMATAERIAQAFRSLTNQDFALLR